MRQGNAHVLVVVRVNGSFASAFCSPTLTWAHEFENVRTAARQTKFVDFIARFYATGGPPTRR